MTLAIRWPHQAGDSVSCWPHEPAHRQLVFPTTEADVRTPSLSKVLLKNWKSFADTELHIDTVTVLIGGQRERQVQRTRRT